MLQETLENIGRSSLAEVYTSIVLAMKAREETAYHPLGILDRRLIQHLWALQVQTLPAVFMTVGNAFTSWHPQFFSAATLECKRFTKDSATADTSDGRRHGDVRIGEPGDPTLRFSSRLLFVHKIVYPCMSSLSSGLGFRRDRKTKVRVSHRQQTNSSTT